MAVDLHRPCPTSRPTSRPGSRPRRRPWSRRAAPRARRAPLSHAARPFHRRGRRRGRPRRHRGHRGRARPDRRLHGDLRTATGGGPREQSARPGLPGRRLLLRHDAVPGTPRPPRWPRPRSSVYDHGARPGLVASRGITCEGLPTGRTDLIRDGVLVGLLSNWYQTQRLLRDPDGPAKLGAAGSRGRARPRPAQRLPPRRRRPGAASTRGRGWPPPTWCWRAARPESLEALVRRVGHGLYIGRIWYTYPINGLRAGDFTCTVVADSYVIRDGRRAAPIRPNTLRINDNLATVLNNADRDDRRVRRAPSCGRPTRSSTRRPSPCRGSTSTRSRASWRSCPDDGMRRRGLAPARARPRRSPARRSGSRA